MTNSTRLRVALAVVMLILTISIAAAAPALSQEADRPENADISPPNETVTSTVETQTNDGPQQYTVVATNSTAIDSEELDSYGTTGTQVGARIELKTTPDQVSTVRNLSWVREVRIAQPAIPTDVAGPADDPGELGVDDLHAQGTTGSSVTVGVIDTGFDPSDPAIADNVVDTNQFGSTGSTDHGTDTAATVVKTAPDVQLSLATIQTTTDFAAALEYFAEQDVDVVVMSLGYPTLNDDGDHRLASDIDQARANDILFITSASNQRQRHWQGEFTDADDDSVHEFDLNDETACVPDCETTFGGRIDVHLSWKNDDRDGSDYQLYLYNPIRGEYLIDSDDRYSSLDHRVESIRATVPQQPVSLVVEHVGGPTDDELEIDVYQTPAIEDPVARSSITAPADVPSAVGVAAYSRGLERTASYSSVGPNDLGEAAVDMTGYTNVQVRNTRYAGTSAAAPQVAGVAALTIEAGGSDATTDEVETVLRETAVDIGSPGRDSKSGAGVVDATAATSRIAETTTDTDPDLQAARTIGENPTPGGTVVVTTNVTVTNASTGLGVTERFTTDTGGSELTAVQIDGEPAASTDITASGADETGVTVAIPQSALEPGTTVTIIYEVTAPDTKDTPVTITGTATNGPDSSTEVGGDTQFTTVASPLSGAAGEFDGDGDGKISASELGDAVNEFGQSGLSAAELGDVVNAFGQS